MSQTTSSSGVINDTKGSGGGGGGSGGGGSTGTNSRPITAAISDGINANNEPRFIGNKPVLALKRYAHDLDTSSNPDAARFKEINRNRVDNFIKKPYDDIHKLHEEFHPSDKISSKKTIFYDYSDHIKHEPLHNLDAPELQRYCHLSFSFTHNL